MKDRIDVTSHGILFAIRLTPKGGRDAVEGWASVADGSTVLKARVAAVPENGKANAALIALLAKALGVSKSAISIAGGKTARMKRLIVNGEPAILRHKLSELGEAK